MTCGRCLIESEALREISVCGLVDAIVCMECRSELSVHVGIEAGATILVRAKRHAEVYRQALVGPAANVADCLRASDVVAGAENALRETIRGWLAERPARGKN